jgi:hypothetical protein
VRKSEKKRREKNKFLNKKRYDAKNALATNKYHDMWRVRKKGKIIIRIRSKPENRMAITKYIISTINHARHKSYAMQLLNIIPRDKIKNYQHKFNTNSTQTMKFGQN